LSHQTDKSQKGENVANKQEEKLNNTELNQLQLVEITTLKKKFKYSQSRLMKKQRKKK
jgi:hypothetical protein